MAANYNLEQGFNPESIPKLLVEKILQKCNPNAKLKGWKTVPIDSSDSILSHVAKRYQDSNPEASKRFIGFCRLVIEYVINEETLHKNIVIKSKPDCEFIATVVTDLGRPAGEETLRIFQKHATDIIVRDTEHREIAICNLEIPAVKDISPEIYLTIDDSAHGVFLIAMEDLGSKEFILQKTSNDVSLWSEEFIEQVLKDLAYFHAFYLGRTETLPKEFKCLLSQRYSAERTRRMLPLITTCYMHNKEKAVDIYDKETCGIVDKALKNIDEIYRTLCSQPYTLIHGDVHTRNLCMRLSPASEKKKKLCLYDLEVCSLHVPHLDVLDFLSHALEENASILLWEKYQEVYRSSLISELKACNNYTEVIQNSLQLDTFQHVFKMIAIDSLLDRLGFFTFSHVYNSHTFLPRVAQNLTKYLKSFAGDTTFFHKRQAWCKCDNLFQIKKNFKPFFNTISVCLIWKSMFASVIGLGYRGQI